MTAKRFTIWSIAMPVRGSRNPVPKKTPAKNSGIFSGNGSQKKDPVNQSKIVKKTLAEAYKNTNRMYSKS